MRNDTTPLELLRGGSPYPPRTNALRSRSLAAACLIALCACAACIASASGTEAPSTPPEKKPIATAKTPLGDLLRKWFAEGTAAGNAGDFYDNRDRGHSRFSTDAYPQLLKIEYTDDARKRNADWALQGRVLPGVVFGNSSTSSGVTNGGSNPRMAYTHPKGLALLYAQYSHNNLYVYPEHQDHDPGHNGNPGHGDVYPTNTPYGIISQGSSGSDQPFLRALAPTLAAFRPAVKKKLVDTGLLMPTVQMILRMTSKRLADPKEYLSGKAHPTVFEGVWVDEMKMARLAHEILPDDIPPAVRLRTVEEDEAALNRDFFDAAGADEILGNTPCVIARVHRSARRDHRIVVSAEASIDLNERPLEFQWIVLRGDPRRIHITPRDDRAAVCEVVIGWHERRPVTEGDPLESNRVDIGVFAHNGKYYSAPAFVTILALDDEARTYADDGRVLEIGYGAGTTEITVPNWTALLAIFKPGDDRLGAALLQKPLKADEIAAVLKAADEYKTAQSAADAAQARSKDIQAARTNAADALKAADKRRGEAKAARDKSPGGETSAALDKAETEFKAAQDADKKADADAAAARKDADTAAKAALEVLTRKRSDLREPVKPLIEAALRNLAASPTFYAENAKPIAAALATADAGAKAAVETARRRLAGFGLLKDAAGDAFDLRPARDGPDPATARLTAFEKGLVEQFNGQVLGRVIFAGTVNFSTRRNYVDPRIATPKSWRDVYQYSPTGECLGWTRYDGASAAEFNAEGQAVIEKDASGRCLAAHPVRYERETPKDMSSFWTPKPLKTVIDPAVIRYEYTGPADWRGHVKAGGGEK